MKIGGNNSVLRLVLHAALEITKPEARVLVSSLATAINTRPMYVSQYSTVQFARPSVGRVKFDRVTRVVGLPTAH